MQRKCSMCGECKNISQFYFMNKRQTYHAYCIDCQKIYIREYMRIYRERQKGR